MTLAHTIANAQLEKLRLQAEIARQRREVDRDVRRLSGEGRRLTSWQTYVARFPGQILAAMFGVGLMAGAGWRSVSWRRQLGGWLLNMGVDGVKTLAWSDLLAIWSSLRRRDDADAPPASSR